MKTPKTIIKEMIADVIAVTDKITYFGKDGVVRGLLHATSNVIGELWSDLYQIKRMIFVETARGSNLDLIASRRGMLRKSATKSSVILLFNGPDATVIPINTIVSSVSGVQYKTQYGITLGEINPDIQRPISEYSIGDAVLAESVESGAKTKVGIKELAQLQTPVVGVTVTNHLISEGGEDLESDEQLRGRIKTQISILNQGTQLFYQTLAQNIESTILKSKAVYNPITTGVKIHVLKDSFALFSASELNNIAVQIYDNQRALSPVVCVNGGIKGISVKFTYTRSDGTTQENVFTSISNMLGKLVRENYDFAGVIKYQDILNIIIDTDGVELNIGSLYVNGTKGDVVCGETEVPRFTSLTINDGTEKAVEIVHKIIRVE